MEHKHSVYDSDMRFVIDPVTRVVKLASKKKTIVQFDHNSERVTFELPRYIEGHDMSLCTNVEVHYLNVDARTKDQKPGYYESKDLKIDPEDEEKVICTWEISSNATQLEGLLNFIVRYSCVEYGVITYSLNTLYNSELTVGKGFNASDLVLTEYVDIIEQWKNSVMQTFRDDISVWKDQKAAELEADLTEWKKAESDEVHMVMGDYETHMNQQLDVERKRIDAFVALKDGSTTGDAELQDIRIGAGGVAYPTAGDAVREQFHGLASGLNLREMAVRPNQTTFAKVNAGNLFNVDEAEILNGYFSGAGEFVTTELFKTAMFKVEPDTLYYTNYVPTQSLNLTFFDGNRNVVKHLPTGTYDAGTIPACAIGAVAEATVTVDNTFNLAELVISKSPIDAEGNHAYYYELPKFRLGFDNMASIVEFAPANNLFNKNAVRTGFEVYADGSIRKQAFSVTSDYCQINGNADVLYIYNLPTYTTGEMSHRYAYFYDVDKNPIGTVSLYIDSTVTSAKFQIPESAKYFVFSIYQRCQDGSALEYDTVMVTTIKDSKYEPYEEIISKIGGKALLKQVSKSPNVDKTLLIFGDSITETATVSDDGSEYTEGTRVNWPTFANDILGVGQMWNFAKSGGHLKDDPGLEHRQWISNQIKAAVNNVKSADIIVISAGTNDSNGKVGTYEDAMAAKTLGELDRTKLYSAIRWAMWTIRVTYPEAVCFAATPIQRADRETDTAVVNAIVEMAKRYNFIVIDANTECGIVRENEVWQADGLYLYDGLHPNKKGAERMAAYYSAEILHHVSTM